MPYTISYSDEVRAEFRASPGRDIVLMRELIGSFKHDGWLRGTPVDGPSSLGIELMQITNGHITLRYELNRAKQQVRIVAIVRE